MIKKKQQKLKTGDGYRSVQSVTFNQLMQFSVSLSQNYLKFVHALFRSVIYLSTPTLTGESVSVYDTEYNLNLD